MSLENTYWNENGLFQGHVKELEALIPFSGKSSSLKGEIFRAANRIYYDFYNNGFGNCWIAPAQFLMHYVNIPSHVESMLYQCADGIRIDDTVYAGDIGESYIEIMMDSTIGFLVSEEFSKRYNDSTDFVYMWEFEDESKIHRFVAECDFYSEDEDNW